MQKGRIIKGYAGFYYVAIDDKIYECKLRGKLRLSQSAILVGDEVNVTLEGTTGVVEEILPRISELIRPPIANVEVALIVFALVDPNPVLELLDRLILAVTHADINPVLIFTKADCATEEAYAPINIYKNAGYDVIVTSALNEEGISEIRSRIAGKISVVTGPSGVGKSTLLNKLQPGLKLKTGEISEKIGRGKHTTRHVELLPLSVGGYIADTPGFSVLYLPDIKKSQLADYYKEFQPLIGTCRFQGCLHRTEPQCSMRKAVEEGTIDLGRYKRYIVFLDQLAEKERTLYD